VKIHIQGKGRCAADIYEVAVKRMDKHDIAHWQFDLFLRKNETSEKIISKYAQREGVGEFVDDVDGDVWFKVFFGYPEKC
jgi:hypothetical protein